MTYQEKILKLRKQLEALKSPKALLIAAQDTHVKMNERIFVNGKLADGSDIGNYNATNELYIDPKKSPKNFPTKGKPNKKGIAKAKFQDGTPHKTGYFKSYKDFRETIGRETSKVNLVLFGDLQSDFGKALIKITDLKYASTLRDNNVKKKDGNESRFGEIFKLSEEEKNNFIEILKFETKQILKSA